MRKKISGFIALALILNILSVFVQLPVMAAGKEYTFKPIADTYSQLGRGINDNFGSDSTMTVRGPDYRTAYLKFDLSTVEGIATSAKLTVYTTSIASGATMRLEVAQSNDWAEDTLKGNNRPTFGYAATNEGLSSVDMPGKQNTAMVFDVPVSAIETALLNNEKYITLVLYNNENEVNMPIHSREATNAAYRPSLNIVTTDTVTDEVSVSKDYSYLTFGVDYPLTKESFELPQSGSNGSSISWRSNSPHIKVENGVAKVVSRPLRNQNDATVTLTAVISKGNVSKEKSFNVLVLNNSHPIEDTYTKAYTPQNRNYGRSTVIISRSNANVSYGRSYLKFDISDLGLESNRYITSAKLKLTLDRTDKYTPQTQYVALTLTDDWSAGEFNDVDMTQDGIDPDKKGITHNTKPAADETLEVSATCETTGGQKGDVYEFDVRELVNSRINNNKDVISFALYSKEFTDKHYEYYSNEASSGRPVLEIEWETADGVAPDDVSRVRTFMRDNGMRIVWDDPIDADYAKANIYRGEELLAEVMPGEQSYFVEGLRAGDEYSLKICTEDKFSNKSEGIEVQGICPASVADTTAPAQVGNVKTESGDKQIRITWTAPVDNDYKKTVIRYVANGENKEKTILRGTNTCLIDSLPNKEAFDFEIYTVDYDGNESESVLVTEKTTEAFKTTLDNFDSSTIFKNGVEVIKDGNTPDESAGYGRFSYVANNTYKYAVLDGAALAKFGATGLRFYGKSNVTMSDRMLFYIELRETEGSTVTKTYQAHLGLMFNGTEWTEIYAPFEMFERVSGSAAVDFKPVDISKVTQIRLITSNFDNAGVSELEICMDDFGAYVHLDEPGNIRVTEADKRLSLSWECDNDVNIYKDGKLMDTVSDGNYIYDGLENGKEYNLELSAVDKNERETQRVSISGKPSYEDAKIEYSRFKDGWGDAIECFTNGQKLYTKTKVVADTDEAISLVYEFYDIDNQVVYTETVTDISLVNGEALVEKNFNTPENAQICLVSLKNNTAIYDEPYVIPEKQENEFAVSPYFKDHMVIQRDNPVIVWGKAPVGETVTVSINGTTKTAVAKNGTWKVKMPAMEYSTSPIEMSVACNGEEVKYTDILVGDVYIGSGQSNMAFKAVNSIGGTDMLNNSPDDGIRIYSPTITSSNNPKENPENVKWFAAEGTSPYVREIFATPYFFAMEMRKVYPDIPIGIVQAGFNGSFMETWVDRDCIKTLVENGVKMTANQAYVKSEWSGLYNGNIHPIRDIYAKAVLWYQGEANANDGYMDKLKMMISNWRNTTQNKELPFIIVNLPIFETNGEWPERREIQYEATQQIANVGMATLYELGNRFDIHPNNKQPVGYRWSLVARHMLFGEDIEYSGPVYDSCEVVGNNMYLTFTHADGLNNGGGNDPISGFEICGADGNFVTANAEITEDGRVRLYADGITPYAARYAWADALPTESYISSQTVDNSIVLTYRAISSRYNVGDEISGFYITDGSSYTKANAVISGENQVTVTKQNNAAISDKETAAYAFLEFPFRNANLYNSQQLPAVPFRTVKDMLVGDDINLELDINEYVTGKINLPSADATGEYTVTWSADSDNVSINGNVAEVIRPSVGAADATGKLIAQIKKDDAVTYKNFEFKIPSLSYPEASAYCQDGSSVTFNFGAADDLKVRTETTGALYMVSFLKFDISYLKKDVDKAALKLTLMKNNSGNKPEDLRVAFSENDNWFTGTDNGVAPENGGVTWKTRPYFERTSQIAPTSTNDGTSAGDVYEFDVTELVEREFLHGDGYITFAIYADTPMKNVYQFYNINAQSGRPELCITETDDTVYISNNGKKLDGKYLAGSLNVSADTTSADSMLIAAFYENDALVKSAVDYSDNTHKSVELQIDRLKNTKVKIFNIDKNTLKPYSEPVVVYPTDGFEVSTKYPNWTEKAITFSFDDGRLEDVPLIEAFDTYGIKGTFNLNSNNHTDSSSARNAQWVVDTYKGHEVASHVKNHPSIEKYTTDEYIQLIKEGKDELSEIVGYEVTGMAYPLDDPNVEAITQYVCSEESGIEYARPSSPMRRDFELPTDFYNWRPSIKFTEMDYYGEAFLNIRNDNKLRLFYAWGHSYELNDNNYYLIHDFGKAVKDREDLYLATNIDICLYLKALQKLEVTEDYVKNNSDIPLYISINNINCIIEPGMTISAD